MRGLDLTVHVSTKLNRSHVVTGEEALILPCLGRTERDRQDGGEQVVTVEDSMGMVHASRGRLDPASPDLLSEVAIVTRLAEALWPDGGSGIDWAGMRADYDAIRDHIERVIPGFERLQRAHRSSPAGSRCRTRRATGSSSRPRPARRGSPSTPLDALEVPAGPPAAADRAQPRPVQHHDLRPRRPLPRHQAGPPGGVREPRRPRRPSGSPRATTSTWSASRPTASAGPRTSGSWPTRPRGAARRRTSRRRTCWSPLDSVAEVSNTPVSKSVVVRLEPRPGKSQDHELDG